MARDHTDTAQTLAPAQPPGIALGMARLAVTMLAMSAFALLAFTFTASPPASRPATSVAQSSD